MVAVHDVESEGKRAFGGAGEFEQAAPGIIVEGYNLALQGKVGKREGSCIVHVLNRASDWEIAIAVGEKVAGDSYGKAAGIDTGNPEGVEVGDGADGELCLILQVERAAAGGDVVETDQQTALGGDHRRPESDGGLSDGERHSGSAVR